MLRVSIRHDARMGRAIAGKYGMDAWYIPVFSGVGAGFFTVLAITQSPPAQWIDIAFVVVLALQALIYLNTVLRGRFSIWQKIISDLPTAPARVLDVGCGTGLVIITALTKFRDAQGVGLDQFRSRSQAGSDPLLTMDNAQLNGVRSRLQLVTEPMLEMSLPGNSFDAVFCNVAIQKIASREARGEVVAQLFRVTKPSGQIRIVDTQFAKQHAEDLAALGAEDTAISALGIRGWYGNPLYASRLISATKPRR